MSKGIDKQLVERLRLIKQKKVSLNVKQEPVEVEQPANYTHPAQVPAPRFNTQVVIPDPQTDTFREQFLNKTISSENIISLHENVQNVASSTDKVVQGMFNRVSQINFNISRDPRLQHSRFYARVPSNSSEKPLETSHHSSPLVQSSRNSLFSFNASHDTAKDVINESSPLGDIPLQVQNVGMKIGANFEKIRESIYEEKTKLEQVPVPTTSNEVSHRVPKHNKSADSKEPGVKQAPLQTEEKSVQTTENTGYLRIELSPNELQNLDAEKKYVLKEFMRLFKINDDRRCSSIRERLQHRMARLDEDFGQSNKQHNYSFGPAI